MMGVGPRIEQVGAVIVDPEPTRIAVPPVVPPGLYPEL